MFPSPHPCPLVHQPPLGQNDLGKQHKNLHFSRPSSPYPRPKSAIAEETSLKSKMANVIGDRFLAKQWERRYFADECHFCPPPWFIPLIVVLEVGVFIYFAIESGTITETIYLNQMARDSLLIYRSDFREEVWRFVTYMFIHVNLIHLLFNLTFQVILGVPLEVVHGSLRIAIIYMTGVLAGW